MNGVFEAIIGIDWSKDCKLAATAAPHSGSKTHKKVPFFERWRSEMNFRQQSYEFSLPFSNKVSSRLFLVISKHCEEANNIGLLY